MSGLYIISLSYASCSVVLSGARDTWGRLSQDLEFAEVSPNKDGIAGPQRPRINEQLSVLVSQTAHLCQQTVCCVSRLRTRVRDEQGLLSSLQPPTNWQARRCRPNKHVNHRRPAPVHKGSGQGRQTRCHGLREHLRRPRCPASAGAEPANQARGANPQEGAAIAFAERRAGRGYLRGRRDDPGDERATMYACIALQCDDPYLDVVSPAESEPLVPPSTKFLLTTNAALAPPPLPANADNAAALAVNSSAFGRYFDRPEVQQACRAQELIQTPEYIPLPEEAIVGGRFRPRGTGEVRRLSRRPLFFKRSTLTICVSRRVQEIADTSDAAYEKRHRKYETFEKRQRLREKEKLKHEQYKLKERIEQLRAMETSAFLALPASSFSEPLGVDHEVDHDAMDTGLTDLPGAHVNGAAAYNEGERRRQEMLEIAEALEERYRILLPPDRKWLLKKEKLKRERESASVALSVEQEPQSEPEPEVVPESEPEVAEDTEEQDEEEGEDDEVDEVDEADEEEAVDEEETVDQEEVDEEDANEVKEETDEEEVDDVEDDAEDQDDETEDEEEVMPPASASTVAEQDLASGGESEVDVEARDREKSKKLKLRIKFPARPIPLPPPSPESISKLAKKPHHNATHTISTLSTDGTLITVKSSGAVRSSDGKFLPKAKRRSETVTSISYAQPGSSPHPRKRRRMTDTDAPPSLPKQDGRRKRVECMLMISAMRNTTANTARKTQRNVTAFGVGVPRELEFVRDYELPNWLRETTTVSDDVEYGHLQNYTNGRSAGVPSESVQGSFGGEAEWDEDTKDEYPADAEEGDEAPDD